MVQFWRLRLRWHRIHFESSSAARSSSFIACLASSIQDGLIKIHVAVSMAKSLNRLPWYVWILCLVLTFEFSFPAACMQPSKGHKGGGSFSGEKLLPFYAHFRRVRAGVGRLPFYSNRSAIFHRRAVRVREKGAGGKSPNGSRISDVPAPGPSRAPPHNRAAQYPHALTALGLANTA